MKQRPAFGTLLKVHDGEEPGEFGSIAMVHNLQPGEMGPDWQEGTHLTSPGRVEQFVATVLRTGEIRADFWWDPAESTHDADDGIIAIAMSGEERQYQLVFLPGDAAEFVMQFDALLRVQLGQADPTGILSGSVTIRPNGPFEFQPE